MSFKKIAAILVLFFACLFPYLGLAGYRFYIETFHIPHLNKLYLNKNKNDILQICGKPMETFKDTETMNSFLMNMDIEFYRIFPAVSFDVHSSSKERTPPKNITKRSLPPVENETFLYEVKKAAPYFMLIYFDKSEKVKYIVWGNG